MASAAPAPAPAVSHSSVSAAAKAEIPIAPTAAAAMRATVTAAAADVLDASTPVPTEAAAAAAAAPTWPCPRCDARVSMELDACDSCGAGFLAGASSTAVSMKLPVFGDVNRMSKGQRIVMAIGIAIALMLFFVLIAEVGGHFI